MIELSDGQMYQNQLDTYLDLLESQIKAYRCSKTVDHMGLTQGNLTMLSLACDFVKTIISAIEDDCRIRDEYYNAEHEEKG